jgi:DNA-binding MarR family transcriptional regulator
MAVTAEDLRGAMQQVVRRFGALSTDRTPCGQPLPLVVAHALMILAARGEATHAELGTELGVDKSNVARACARIVRAGYATQRVGADDRRRRYVALTERGRVVAREVERASQQRFATLLGQIPSARRREVVDALQLVATLLARPRPAHRTRERHAR